MNKITSVLISKHDGWKKKERVLTCLLSMLSEFDEIFFIDCFSENGSSLEECRSELPKTGKLHHFQIPPELFETIVFPYYNADKCGDYMRNIGIRRATGDWIISTNVDIIAPRRELLEKCLKNKNTFYTVSRREAPLSICDKYKPQSWKRLRTKLDKTVLPRYYLDGISPNDYFSIFNSCGDFQVASREIWHNIRGFEEFMKYSLFTDSNVQKKVVMHGFNLRPLFNPPVYHMEHANYCDPNANTVKKQKNYNNPGMCMELFEMTHNSRDWGCADLDLKEEIL